MPHRTPAQLSRHMPEDTLPIGLICMWSGLLVDIPVGWDLCDGSNGTPDLRDYFVVGAAAGANPGATGGGNTHTHAGHAAHVVTQPTAHIFTQPSGHSAHGFTQPAGHSAHIVTQPSDHADVLNHVHRENRNSATTGGLDGWAAGDTSTNTPLLTGYSTANPTTGGVAAQVHAGAAVDAHSAHSGGAVDAHSAHSGGAVDAHSGAAVDAHSAHDTADSRPLNYALAYIMKN